MTSVRVALDGGRLLVTADNQAAYGPFKEMLAATWDNDRQAIVLPATVGAMEELTVVIGSLRAQGVVATRSADTAPLLQAVQAAQAARDKRYEEDLPDFPGKLSAWIHQRQAFWFAEPQFGTMLAMDMGCLTGDTIVTANRAGRSFRIRLDDLHAKFSNRGPLNRYRGIWDAMVPTYVRGLKADGRLGRCLLRATLDNGIKEVCTIRLASGMEITCTPDHEIVTPAGKVQAANLEPGASVWTNGSQDGAGYVWLYMPDHPNATPGGQVLEHQVVMAEHLGRPIRRGEIVHHDNEIKNDNRLENLVLCASQAEHMRLHDLRPNLPGVFPVLDVVLAIEDAGRQRVYDLSVDEDAHTYIANGIVVGNTGKSKVTVGLLDHWDTDLALILCPKSVVGVWPREFEKHSERTWNVWAGQVQGARGPLKNPSVSKRAAAADLHAERFEIAGGPAAIVCNYDSCWQPAMEKVLLKLARAGRIKVMVLDESHRVKAPNGKASRFCFRLSRAIEARGGRVLELTGTPFSHSPLDVFGQYRCLDPAYFGTNHARFKRRYAIEAPLPTGRATMIVGLQPETEGDLRARFHKLAYVCNKRDLVERGVLHIPPATEDFRECTLGTKATDLYRALEEEFVADLEQGTVTVANAMVKLLRLQQITSGHVPLDDIDDAPAADEATIAALAAMGLAAPAELEPGRRRQGRIVEVDTAKRDLLADTLTDIPTSEPVVVFCRFRHDLDMVNHVAKAQGRTYAELSGRRRDALAPDSTLAEHVRLAGVQIQSGGVGIDFTRACLGIYFSIGHALGDYEQSLARLDRPGQLMPTTFLHLVARLSSGVWTADRRVYQALFRRLDVVRAVMRSPGRWGDEL